jgi:glutathione synthase/RimK-type ligase-like ATP-grasp enzyme
VKFSFVVDKSTKAGWRERISPGIGILNQKSLAEIADDKLATFRAFSEYSPLTMPFETEKQMVIALKKIRTEKVVVKPRFGLEGKKVRVVERENAMPDEGMIVQEFIDTSGGISGVTGGIHDLRVIILDGNPVYQYVRQPNKGLLSNVSLGGKLMVLESSQIPNKAVSIALHIDALFRGIRPRFYTVDFLFDSRGQPWICELNSKPGLYPSEGEDTCTYRMIFKKLLGSIKNSFKTSQRARS